MRTNKLLLIAVFAFLPLKSWGYSYSDNRGLFPMGEQEELMANTGIALSGSTGAVSYNPAGLASLQKNHISLSANSYLQTHTHFDAVQNLDGVDQPFSGGGTQSIPTAFVSTWHTSSMVWAFSVLVPHSLKIQDTNHYSTPAYDSILVSRMQSLELLMAGFSGARKFGDFDAGAGCFYTMYNITAQQTASGHRSATSGLAADLVNDTYDHGDASGLFCNAGIQKQQSDQLRWGVALHLPFIAFNKSGTSSQFAQLPNGNSGSIDPHSVDFDYQIPADLGFGIEYKHSALWRSYADLSYQFAATTGGSEKTSYKATPRVNYGLDYKWSDTLHILGGLAYNPGATDVDSANYSENFMIATAGFRVMDGNSSLGLGVLYAQSTGHNDVLEFDKNLNQTGTKSGGVTTQATGLMINSGYVF